MTTRRPLLVAAPRGWGIDTLDYTSDSSALVIWDSDSDPIPVEAVASSISRDPHGDPRNDGPCTATLR